MGISPSIHISYPRHFPERAGGASDEHKRTPTAPPRDDERLIRFAQTQGVPSMNTES